MPYTDKEKSNEYSRLWKKKNRKKVNEWNKKYRSKDPLRWINYRRKWEKDNYEHRKSTARRSKIKCEQCLKETLGFRKSQRFCSRKCMGLAWSKPSSQSHPYAYRRKWIASKKNKIPEHRWIMQNHLGRPLKKTEVVHHIDHDKKNNCISNLMLFKSNSDHIKFHRNEEKRS